MANFLDKSGVELLWSKVKEQDAAQIKANVTDKLGVANGIATLGADAKLTASQLPALKTVNGESIVGSGNIAIDLSIYQIVDSLPESNQNPNKIYLVLTSPATGQSQDVYSEYLWTGTAWEKLGEYKATVDLTPYLKIEDIAEKVAEAGFLTEDDVKGILEDESVVTEDDIKDFVKFTDVPTSSKNGVMTYAQVTKLEGIADEATKDAAIPTSELEAIFV